MTSRQQGVGSIVGSLGFNIFPSFAGFDEALAQGIVDATTAKALFIGNAMEELGRKVFTRFTIPLAVATAANIAQFQALDREIRTVLTLFGTAPSLIDRTFNEMREGIQEVSRDVGGLERDIADGLYQAISAGVPRGGVFDFLDVAQMAAIADKTADLTTAVDGLTTVLNAFGLEADETSRVADVMFQTVALGKTTFGELSNDIGRVAPLAANAGVAFEELFAIIGATTLQGLKTSEAVSFLRAGITGLLRPTDELNAIFQELGFSSAEAAIPIIGLQAAFQAVVEAADGSTSQLQELIGTSEGVSAILGVTGDNAANFARIFQGVEQSTGAATRAFEIMDDSVGRSFGRLTESFDALGNTFGELGAELIVPFADAASSLIVDLAEGFRSVLPFAKELGEVFGNVLAVFELPVIKEISRAFAGLVVSVGGLVGVLGGLLFFGGKFVVFAAQLLFASKAFRLLRKPVLAAAEGVNVLGNRMVAFGDRTRDATGQMTRFGKSAAFAGKSFNLLAGGLVRQIGSMLAIGLAIQGLFVAYTKWREHTDRLVESTQIFSTQLDALAEQAGLVNNAITFEGLGRAGDEIQGFIDQNIALVRQLRETRELMGDTAVQQQILTIGAQLVWRGNSPEQVQEVLDDLAESAGITIDVEFAEIQGGDDPADFLNVALEGMESRVDEIVNRIENREPGTTITAAMTGSLRDAATGLSEVFAFALQEGEGQRVLDLLGDIDQRLGGEAKREFFTTLTDQFAALQDLDVGAGPTSQSDLDAFLQAYRDFGIDLEEEIQKSNINKAFEETKAGDIFGAIRDELGATADAIAPVVDLTQEEIDKIAELQAGLGGVLAGGRDFILQAFSDIQQGFQAQIPLFEVYQGAVEINFQAWKDGHAEFQADLAAVADLRTGPISEMPEAVQDAFDAASLNEQAWLASLGADELEEALGIMVESFNAVDATAGDFFVADLPEIVAEAGGLMLDEYNAMEAEALAAGKNVHDNFETELALAKRTWPAIVTSALGQIDFLINSHNFPNIILPNPVFGGDSDIINSDLPLPEVIYNYSATVISPTTDDLAADLDTANRIQETQRLASAGGS